MSAALYGLIAAIGWGCADFIARFTSRSVGVQQSLFGMMLIGLIALNLLFWWLDLSFVLPTSKLWLLLLSGLFLMLATLLLYQALALGPVSVVAPLVGSYPVFNMGLAIILGTRPNMIQWLSIFTVLSGVWIVGSASDHFTQQAQYSRKHLRRVIILSLSSAIGFGIFIASSQTAIHYFGDLQTIYLSRLIGLIALGLYFIKRGISPQSIGKSWHLVILQGLFDTIAVAAVTLAAWTENAEIAVVTSSGFCVVTIILARIILHERITWHQFFGITFIVVGVALLSIYS